MHPTNNSVIEGDTMTRTMKDRNMNIVSPVLGYGSEVRSTVVRTEGGRDAYIVWNAGPSGCGA
jgi:hypothetical protein